MTIDEAREWLQRHADNTPMPGAREAYKTILEALERTRWVPVEEHIPKNRYLLCTDGNVVYVAMLALDGTWRSPNWGLCRHPTHWMLLPKPPGVE